MSRKLNTLSATYSGSLRYETLEGIDYLVAPMVMITEGVHVSNNGAVYYSANELAKFPENWNHKPCVIYHPSVNGSYVSACDPDILNNRKVGMIMNTKWDENGKKLRAEAWFNINRLQTVDPRVLDNLEKGTITEVSTGVFSENYLEEGTWGEETYSEIATALRADHLAILPDKVGACSIADGAGLLQVNEENIITALRKKGVIQTNETGQMEIQEKIQSALYDRFGYDAWVVEVYSNDFIYSRVDTYYRLGYTTSESGVVLSEQSPQKVKRDVSYVLISNEKKEDEKMPNKVKVDALIANKHTKWSKEDSEFLLTLSDDQLDKLEPTAIEKEVTKVVDPVVEKKEEPTTEKKPITMNEYLNLAPPEIQEVLRDGMTAHVQKKGEFIERIMANEANRFTKEQLDVKPLGELEAIASFCVNKEEEVGHPVFLGNAGAYVPASRKSDVVEEPYIAPVMSWNN